MRLCVSCLCMQRRAQRVRAWTPSGAGSPVEPALPPRYASKQSGRQTDRQADILSLRWPASSPAGAGCLCQLLFLFLLRSSAAPLCVQPVKLQYGGRSPAHAAGLVLEGGCGGCRHGEAPQRGAHRHGSSVPVGSGCRAVLACECRNGGANSSRAFRVSWELELEGGPCW